jgi:hypothetical protein
MKRKRPPHWAATESHSPQIDVNVSRVALRKLRIDID